VIKQLWEKIVSLAGSNFGLKALALTIAVGLWLAGHRDTERAIEAPVEFRSIAAGLLVIGKRAAHVGLRMMRPRSPVSPSDAYNW